MKPKYCYAVIVVLLLLVVAVRPALGTRHIPTDTGIGTWDPVNRIYTLTTDVYETLYIDEDDLTLDGAGHTVAGSGTGNGIEALLRSDVLIKSVSVTGWSEGIHIWDSRDISMKELTCESNDGCGVSVWFSDNIIIKCCALDDNTLSGIEIVVSNRVEVSGSECSHNGGGICGAMVTDIRVTDNTCIGNGPGIGLDGERIEIFTNKCSQNNCGIWGHLADSKIANNTCTENGSSGIELEGWWIQVSGNNCSYNNRGISGTSLGQCRLADNTCNNNDMWGIDVISSHEVELSGNECSHNTTGISLFELWDCKLVNNACIGNDASGIWMFWSPRPELSGNNCSYNNYGTVFSGYLYHCCSNVTVTDNTFEGNSSAGVYFNGGRDVTMAQNNFTKNGTGAEIEYGLNMAVSDNHFRGNATQASVKDSIDVIFDRNYWHDYTGQDLDGDGFGETPYLFPGGQDNHPRVYKKPIADADGPYEGVVGQPIVFDGSGSHDPDGEIEWYCWVWGPDGEGSASHQPIYEHTWYSRFSGSVTLAVIDDEGLYCTDTASVEVTGPERIMSMELASCADLHVYDPQGRHLGVNYETNTIEQNIPGASFRILDKEGNEVPYDGDTPEEGLRQVVNLPILAVGSYRILLTGTSDGPCHLTINGVQDGEVLCCKTYEGQICSGECMTTNAVAVIADDILTLEFEPLICLPALGVEPGEVTVSAQSNSVQEVIFAVGEMMGKSTLHSVTIHCTDLIGKELTIKGSDVNFDLNNFDVAAGGEQVVHAFISVPWGFRAKVTGQIVVQSADGGTESIAVTIKPARRYPMVVDAGGPYEGVVGQAIRFDASGSYNPNGEIVWYGWDFDSSGKYQGSRLPVCEHTWDAPFSGTVTLVVTDEQGHASAATTTVVVNPAP